MAKESREANPAVEVARARRADIPTDGTYTLSTGVRVRLRPVAARLLAESRSRIKDPPVPIWENPDKGRKEENENDPQYQKELLEARIKRNEAATDALVMFGVELLDGLPADTGWLARLRFLGYEVDDSDPIAVEFAYKRYIAVAATDLQLLDAISSPVALEEVKAAMASFRGHAGRGSD